MFVLELSKPSGICLAAMADEEMVGYLICSRYDTVWHVMNVCVDPHFRRRGIALALLSALFGRGGGARGQDTPQGPPGNAGGVGLFRPPGLPAPRPPRPHHPG